MRCGMRLAFGQSVDMPLPGLFFQPQGAALEGGAQGNAMNPVGEHVARLH